MFELLDYSQPTKYIVRDTNYSNDYDVPVLTAGQTFILGYTNETDGVYQASKENPVIIFDDFTTSFHWVDFCFKVKSSAIKILTPKSNVSLKEFRYIFYAMKCINYMPTNHERHWIGKYSQFNIPIPVFNEQVRIVSILDRFDKLCNDISNGLPAEINARQKQYEYYKKQLFAFSCA